MLHQEQYLQNMNQAFVLNEFLKKLTQFVLSFSVFSFFILYPSWLPFFHSFVANFSTFHSQLLTLATDKNYIFLLCNGILVFIAKYSSRTVNSHASSLPETSPDDDIIFNQYTQSLQPAIEKSLLAEDVATVVNEEEERLEANKSMPDEEICNFLTIDDRQSEGETNHGIFNDSTHDRSKEYMKEESESGSYMEEEKEKEAAAEECMKGEEEEEEYMNEEEEEEEIGKMSSEELNKKFDDFIRKMKEELRFEAQQQLIMV